MLQHLAILHFLVAFLIASPLLAKTFAPAGAGFSVNMPGKPSLTETTRKSFVGPVKENSYSVKTGGVIYTASFSDLPGIAVALGGSGTILDKARDGLLKEAGGTEVSFEKIKLGNNEGRELFYRLPGRATGQARFFLVGKRLYVVVGSGPPTALPAIQRFINSFQLP